MPIAMYHGLNLMILVCFLILLVGEGITAIGTHRDRPTYTAKETGSSLAVATMFAIGNSIISLFVVAFYSFVFVLTPIHLPELWHSSTSMIGLIITVLVALVWTDFMYYWGHRGGHTIRVMWASHSVHHSSKEFNYSTAGRLHPFDHVAGILLNLPLILLGFNPVIVLTVGLLGPGISLFFHTQYVKKLPKPIEYVFNTPSHHRVHHASQQQYLDSNFGAIFMVWDRAFGTYADEQDLPEYGLTKPIQTQNPVKVMSHGWLELIGDVKSDSSASDRIRHLVKRPGWSPDRSQLGKQKNGESASDQLVAAH